jgi:hypothetical protein
VFLQQYSQIEQNPNIFLGVCAFPPEPVFNNFLKLLQATFKHGLLAHLARNIVDPSAELAAIWCWPHDTKLNKNYMRVAKIGFARTAQKPAGHYYKQCAKCRIVQPHNIWMT